MQSYQYKPLPTKSSIRILILYPAANTLAPLEIDLLSRDRLALLQDPDNKTFDAVSYVWGHGAHDIPLYCRSEAIYLHISSVVEEMLRSLRKEFKERRLWVDALCLNQKDEQEKSIQVQQMGQIYHMANKVHIWLGPAVPSIPSTFAFLRTLVAKFEPTPGQAKRPTVEEILDTFEETCQHRNFQPVLDLLQQPWFTRRWTLQEGFLAREALVRCGNNKISWHWFTEGLRLIHNRVQELQDIQNDRSALYALDVLEILRAPADLLSLIWILHLSQCSDPRDKVYSLLGLAQSMSPVLPYGKMIGYMSHKPENRDISKKEMPIPDYRLNEEAAFRGLVGHCIWADRFLQILFHVDAFGPLSEVNPKWPSWIPNWVGAREQKHNSLAAMAEILPPSRCIDKDVYCANRYQRYNWEYWPILDDFIYPRPIEFSKGSNQGLIIYGEFHEQIVEICDPWPESDISDHLAKYLTDWIHQKTILRLTELYRYPEQMEREVMNCLLLLITGTHFFGYAQHGILKNAKDMVVCAKWVRTDPSYKSPSGCVDEVHQIANLVYPIVKKPYLRYTSEQLQLEKNIDRNYCSNPLPTADHRQALSYLLDDISTMMRKGKKRLIVASGKPTSSEMERRHWIGPSDVRMGDVITNITLCGRIGALLRPHNSPSELDGRPVFQLIGILWSLEDIYLGRYMNQQGEYPKPDEFLIF